MMCTLADAAAGGTPMLMSKVLEMTPNAIPNAPSISWATKPTRMKGRSTDGSAKTVGIIAQCSPCCGFAPCLKAGQRTSLASGNSAKSILDWSRTVEGQALVCRPRRISGLCEGTGPGRAVEVGSPHLSRRLGTRLPSNRALALRWRALFPRARRESSVALPYRDRYPSGRDNREALLHRSRLHGHRRDSGNRRRRHDLSVRDSRRYESA